MCLAIPSKIISIEDSRATIDVYGAQRDISLMLLEGQVKIGDYVIVHAGLLSKTAGRRKGNSWLFNQYLGCCGEEELALPSSVKTKRAKKKN
jgi:hydrogenase maturation factor